MTYLSFNTNFSFLSRASEIDIAYMTGKQLIEEQEVFG